MTNWVAADAGEYVRIASHWANQPKEVVQVRSVPLPLFVYFVFLRTDKSEQAFREELPKRFAQSEVSDCRGLAIALEKQFFAAWEQPLKDQMEDEASTEF